MSTTASWPVFSTTASVDNRIDLIGAQNKFNKIMAQNNTSNEDSNDRSDELSSHPNTHSQQMQSHFNTKSNTNVNIGNTGPTNGQIMNTLPIDNSQDEEFDDEEDEDSMIESIGDDDSLPSPDAMYATSYLSNDSNERNGIHDETNKEDIGSEGQSIGDQSPMGPLAQLQNALERHSGMLGMGLTDFSPANGSTPSMFGFNNNSVSSMGTPFNADNDITGELYRCHLCSYSGTSKCQFNAHMNTHFDHKCPFCDYTSRTEGRLKRHIRDFHSEVPPDSWAGSRVLKENSPNEGEESMDATDASVNGSGGHAKNRKYKCKQCQFVATCKQEFWDHSKEHIKSEKLLTCPKCNFVTEYKHHLEYHLRNHFGSKPFKCAKCNYSCVNKSMLNSHMKSHSNIYQYRCADCSYATKYCHSLKLHLRKYQHKPATVLNLDGTPNPYPVIDVYGTRRGPRPKKPKSQKNSQKSQQIDSSLPQTPILSSRLSPSMLTTTPIPPLIPTSMPMGLPFMYPPNPALLHSGLLGGPGMPHLANQLNSIPHSLYDSPPVGNKSSDSEMKAQNQSAPHLIHKLKCNFCEYTAETRELFGKHLLLHVAAENQDICKMYAMNPTAEMLQQNAIINELAARQSPDSRRLLEQIAVNPSFISTLLGMHSLPKPEQLMALEWHSSQDSNTNTQSSILSPQPLLTGDDRDIRPESAPVGPNNKSLVSPLPRSRSSPTDSFESYLREKSETNSKQMSASETTPLDLSSNKSISPFTQPIEPKISILTQHLTQSTNLLPHISQENVIQKRDAERESGIRQISPSGQSASVMTKPEQQSRAQRRKGRASKLNINRCLKMNDQSLKSDDLDEDNSEETADSVPEEPDVDHIITKINSATNLLQEILIDMYSLKNDVYH